jgi:hypothetical protein
MSKPVGSLPYRSARCPSEFCSLPGTSLSCKAVGGRSPIGKLGARFREMLSMILRFDSGAPRVIRRAARIVSIAILAFLSAAVDCPGRAQTTSNEADDPSGSPITQFATRVVTAIEASGQTVDRENVSRFFATYPVATDQAESRRLISTANRILVSFAETLIAVAAGFADTSGNDEIQATHVQRAVATLLPRRPTEFKTAVFFPLAARDEQLEIEIVDLEAFAHTPFPWSAMIEFEASRRSLGGAALPLTEEALPGFAQGLSDYGLLLFRLAGVIAREELARELSSPHLRQAEKAIAARAQSRNGKESPHGDDRADVLVDVAATAGIQFRHVSSDWLARFRRFGPFAPTFSGGGASAGDLDGDGRPDLVLCGGDGCATYLNRGDGTFEDVSVSSGLQVPGEARMAVLADLDNDGDRDAFITYARDSDRLFENLGSARFQEVTAESGVRTESTISGPAIAFDYDNDGLLDLYVGRFGDYLAGETPWQAVDNDNAQPNRLYRNLGNLRFEDVTESAGVGDTGWAQAISHVDYNLDGYQDIYISNDFGRNELFENRGDGTFTARGAGIGLDDEFHGMNVAFADFNRDGYPDIFITNIWGWMFNQPGPGEFNKLFLSRPTTDGVAFDLANHLIPELQTRDTGWSWAALFFDAENDGDDDLFLVNGHSDYSTFLQYRPHPTRPGEIYPINNGREENLFFRNDGGILRVPEQPTGAELGDLNSRSIALLDFDGDGDEDLAVTTFHEHARLFRNDLSSGVNNWLEVELVGNPEEGCSRDAIGAQLIARSGEGLYVWRAVTGGEGYLGMSDLPVHIGLGDETTVDLEIIWPGRQVQHVVGVGANQRIRIRQGEQGFEPRSVREANEASGRT